MTEPKLEIEKRMDRIEQALVQIAANLPYPNLSKEVEDILNGNVQSSETDS